MHEEGFLSEPEPDEDPAHLQERIAAARAQKERSKQVAINAGRNPGAFLDLFNADVQAHNSKQIERKLKKQKQQQQQEVPKIPNLTQAVQLAESPSLMPPQMPSSSSSLAEAISQVASTASASTALNLTMVPCPVCGRKGGCAPDCEVGYRGK